MYFASQNNVELIFWDKLGCYIECKIIHFLKTNRLLIGFLKGKEVSLRPITLNTR